MTDTTPAPIGADALREALIEAQAGLEFAAARLPAQVGDFVPSHLAALKIVNAALASAAQPAAPAAQGDALDSDRLNWLEANAQITIDRLRRIGSEKRVYEVASNDDEIYGEGETLRAAIDAASAANEWSAREQNA